LIPFRVPYSSDIDNPTLPHALGVDSPAIDSASSSTCLSADQRGLYRNRGQALCDIGAFELVAENPILPGAIQFTKEEITVGEYVNKIYIDITWPGKGQGKIFLDIRTKFGTSGTTGYVHKVES